MEASSVTPTRPHHRRNASSKSNVFKALVSARPRGDASSIESPSKQCARVNNMPILPPDHPHAIQSRVLGERQGNLQPAPPSPSKDPPNALPSSKTSGGLPQAPLSKSLVTGSSASPPKSKSSANLVGMLGMKNRSKQDSSHKDQKDKENTTPPSSPSGPLNTPIWAQFATTAKPNAQPRTSDSVASHDVRDEIAKYTPQDYSPSKQRNFNGSFEQPQLRPALHGRPQSMYAMGADAMGPSGRRASGDRTSILGRKSEDMDRHKCHYRNNLESEPNSSRGTRPSAERKASGSSMEQNSAKETLDIAKRGGRVMAAVAALQGKSKGPVIATKNEAPSDPKAVDEAFEAVLDSRNVPEPMRRKMRALTLRVKADFVKQDQEASKSDRTGLPDAMSQGSEVVAPKKLTKATASELQEDDTRSTKRSRTRSRTFTFSKGDKSGDASPSKRQRSSSKSRSHATQHDMDGNASTPTPPRSSSENRRSGGLAIPTDYIKYLRSNQDPVLVEVGRLHKLRILLRNETVAWVDSFVCLGGMTEIVGLLHRIMELEWREEHEDQLLHETLLCLKGLCTTERAMADLEKVSDLLFPKLMAMLFDEEKKGPAEYSTRAIIITVLFNYLTAATTSLPEMLEQRARKLLAYMADPAKPDEVRPLEFVLDMRTSRPYKLWSREITHVTKEVFWIFLHHLNVVPLPKGNDDLSSNDVLEGNDAEEKAKVLAATYAQRHFPGTRPPVPAAPYIGGVEWDATTYITAHLDLLNGLLASIPTSAARNELRAELQASGFEKVLGGTLRTCKEKFYGGVHDGLRAWVAAAAEDGWESRFVREGPTQEEQARSYSPKKSPRKKDAAPKLDLQIADEKKTDGDGGEDGWLG